MTTLTTHLACPVDGTPCWRDRECPHEKDGVRACVRDVVIKPVPFVEFTPDVLDKLQTLWAKDA